MSCLSFFLTVYKSQKAAFETTKHSLVWVSEPEPEIQDLQLPREEGWKAWEASRSPGSLERLGHLLQNQALPGLFSSWIWDWPGIILPQSCRLWRRLLLKSSIYLGCPRANLHEILWDSSPDFNQALPICVTSYLNKVSAEKYSGSKNK